MGLDITWASNAKLSDFSATDDAGDEHGLERVYANPYFADRANDLPEGWYEVGETGRFRAGSYGGYNHWREKLAEFSGWPLSQYDQFGRAYPSYAKSAWDASEGPFWELINFSDCEGCIGPAVSAKLLADFDAHREAMLAKGDEHFMCIYDEFRNAFAKAMQGGFVKFH